MSKFVDTYLTIIKSNRIYHIIGVICIDVALTLFVWALSGTRFADAIATFITAVFGFFIANYVRKWNTADSAWKETTKPVRNYFDAVSREFAMNLGDRNLIKLALFAIIYGFLFVAFKSLAVVLVQNMNDPKIIIAFALLFLVPLIAPELVVAYMRELSTKREARNDS